MKTATVSLYLDRSHPRKDGTCSVSIRITYNRKKKYYPTGITLLPEKFDALFAQRRRNESDKSLLSKIHLFLQKANDVVGKIEFFTFSIFEDMYLTNKDAAKDLSCGFECYIEILEKENKIGTASSYRCALNSLLSFRSNITYADITTDFLRSYYAWMKQRGLSDNTSGIYLRNLRAILNRANIDRSLYPFGRGGSKFSIPSGRNFKKALTPRDIALIYNYNPQKWQEGKARDYWIFLYLCNGMNVKDFCNLKWLNFNGDTISFIREKSRRSRQDNLPVIVSVKPEATNIISKWGIPSVYEGMYIFPHLEKEMSPKKIYTTVQQLTKFINKYMGSISYNLGIQKKVTTIYARHSFATILKNSGASTEYISESLNHSSVKTTRNYLSSFDLKQIHQTTESLRVFSEK